MTGLDNGRHGSYLWLQRPLDSRDTSRPLGNLVKSCPEAILGRHVVVTSLDSGSLQLSDQQRTEGWQKSGRLAISPRISATVAVPYEWFDEWYVFDEPKVPADIEVFVNYGTFSLGDPYPAMSTMYIGSDKSAVDRMVEGVLELRQRFWTQIERLQPLSYISNGHCFLFVTQEQEMYDRAIASFQELE